MIRLNKKIFKLTKIDPFLLVKLASFKESFWYHSQTVTYFMNSLGIKRKKFFKVRYIERVSVDYFQIFEIREIN